MSGEVVSVPVTLWTKPSCVQCVMTKKEMLRLGVTSLELDITQAIHADDLSRLMAEGFASAPIVEMPAGFFVNDPAQNGKPVSSWAGFRPDLLAQIPSLLAVADALEDEVAA